MDPDACWMEMLALLEGLHAMPSDQALREQAILQLQALAQWLQKGGFPPLVTA